jgi:hypothetical protein
MLFDNGLALLKLNGMKKAEEEYQVLIDYIVNECSNEVRSYETIAETAIRLIKRSKEKR